MWTRGSLPLYKPDTVRPWHQHLRNGERGRLLGSYPGYGTGLIRGGFMPVALERGGAIAPGFGIAMDPSDPSTWTRPVRVT